MNVIRGWDNLIRGVELKVFQPKLNRTATTNQPLKLIIPFEIKKTVDSISTRPRRVAAANAGIKRSKQLKSFNSDTKGHRGSVKRVINNKHL